MGDNCYGFTPVDFPYYLIFNNWHSKLRIETTYKYLSPNFAAKITLEDLIDLSQNIFHCCFWGNRSDNASYSKLSKGFRRFRARFGFSRTKTRKIWINRLELINLLVSSFNMI